MGRVVSLQELKPIIDDLRRRGGKVVFTNGCFDILHAGHVQYLKEAKSLGDILIVGINSDSSVKAIKGEKRPIIPQDERVEVLSALECVDYVVLFDDPTPLRLIEEIGPDVLVKGEDWERDKIVGKEVVERRGGEVKRVPLKEGVSTTGIIERICRLYGGKG